MRDTLKNPYIYTLMIFPAIALYSLFFIYPMLTSFYYGVTDWNGLNEPRFVGLGNFSAALADAGFRNAIRNNLIFIAVSVFVQIPLIVVFALLISSVKRLKRFYKTTVFLPAILSTSVIGILWGFMYNPEVGIVNHAVRLLGFDTIYWLADPKWALPAILIVNAWQWMGFFIVLILAAILGIPQEIEDAAKIDGAGGLQRAIRVTVPLIMPVISVVIMLSIAGAMKVVDIVLVMTGGGPAGATEVMASYMVTKAINYGEYGYGTALAILIFAMALLLTALYQLLFARRLERMES